jgi:light-harvesting complex 1 beta chain
VVVMASTNPKDPAMSLTDDSLGFHGLFAASFIVFLVVAIVAQLFMFDWRAWFPGAESEKSLIRGVAAAVYTFMSHLA